MYSDVLDVSAAYVAVTAWFWVQFGNSKSDWLLIARGECKKTFCSLLTLHFAQFTVCCDKYEHDVTWWFIVHKLTVYSKMLLSSTDQSHYTLHSFVAFCPIRSFLPVQLQELLCLTLI